MLKINPKYCQFSLEYRIGPADKAFTATNGLISQSFVVAFVHPTYMQIALIWGFPAQLSLWKLVYWLWRYKLNEVCDNSRVLSLKKLKYILENKLIKYNLSSEKSKRTEWGFLKIVAILNTLLSRII